MFPSSLQQIFMKCLQFDKHETGPCKQIIKVIADKHDSRGLNRMPGEHGLRFITFYTSFLATVYTKGNLFIHQEIYFSLRFFLCICLQ